MAPLKKRKVNNYNADEVEVEDKGSKLLTQSLYEHLYTTTDKVRLGAHYNYLN